MAKKNKGVEEGSAKKKHGPIFYIVIAIIVLVIVAAAAGGNDNSDDATTTASSTNDNAATSAVSTEPTTTNAVTEEPTATETEPVSQETTVTQTVLPVEGTVTNGYGLEVETSHGPQYWVISVYGNSAGDFATMEQSIIDAANTYGLADQSQTIQQVMDGLIGAEGVSDQKWNTDDWQIITSAPNEYESWYKVDLYIANSVVDPSAAA